MSHPQRQWRQDIQVLRAVAVLSVVAFHLGFGGLSRGDLGVDIFFVISGYLLGGRLEAMCERGQGHLLVADLRAFWQARIVRLWPASIGTVLIFTLPCYILLDAREWQQFLQQMLGAVSLTTNVVLWQQVDYFGSGAATKPLLHYWSLSVEEQFYLLLPALFFLRRKRWRIQSTWLLCAASLALFTILSVRSPSAAFYFLPTRAWELALGVGIALGNIKELAKLKALWLGLIGWVVLFAILALGNLIVPQLAMVLACVSVAVLLAIPTSMPEMARFFVLIGDRSYAIYLVHWPIIALVHNVWMHSIPITLAILLLVCIALAAEALWRGVDNNLPLKREYKAWLALQGVILLAGAIALHSASLDSSSSFRNANEGLGIACNSSAQFDTQSACKSGSTPSVLVWGDSFAMQLVPGLAKIVPGGVMQAAHVVCPPIIDLAPVGPGYSQEWAKRCIAWNDSVLRNMQMDKRVERVIMASIFNQLVRDASPEWSVLIRVRGEFILQKQDDRVLLDHLNTTIAKLRQAGKTVALYQPQPYADYDIGRCLSRRQEGLWTLGVSFDCGFAQAESAHSAKVVHDFFARNLAGAAPSRGFHIVNPEPALCPLGYCAARKGQIMLYADNVHLSRDGSIWIASRLDWGNGSENYGYSAAVEPKQ